MVYIICGQKGTGKSLYSVNYFINNRKKYKKVYSNKPIKGTYYTDSYNWVFKRFDENCAIVIDEAQLYFNSREFSKLTKSGVGMALLDYLTMCRHYKLDIFFITQSINRIDLQIRELADYVYHLKRTFKILNNPFLVFGYKFPDIMEFEKFINPNNFSKQYDCRFLFSLINPKTLKAYDTHFIDEEYINKEKIEDSLY